MISLIHTRLAVMMLVTLGVAAPLLAQRDYVSGEQIIFHLTDATYQNTNDGAIIPNITVGYRPFDYTWTGPNGFVSKDSVLTHLVPGTYFVHIEDALCGKLDDSMQIVAVQQEAIIPQIEVTAVGPNPFSNILRLTLRSKSDFQTDISLYSNFGIQYLHQIESLSTGQNKITLDVSSLPAGTYFLNIVTPDKVKLTTPLVKS
jgi:hypothetical protein